MTTSDISPYLLRPVRSLEEAKAQAEQQRLEILAASMGADAEKSGNPPTAAAAETASTS